MKTIVFSSNRDYSIWIIETNLNRKGKAKKLFGIPQNNPKLPTSHDPESIWSVDVDFSQFFNLKRIYRLWLEALPQKCTLKNVLLTWLQIPVYLECILYFFQCVTYILSWVKCLQNHINNSDRKFHIPSTPLTNVLF